MRSMPKTKPMRTFLSGMPKEALPYFGSKASTKDSTGFMSLPVLLICFNNKECNRRQQNREELPICCRARLPISAVRKARVVELFMSAVLTRMHVTLPLTHQEANKIPSGSKTCLTSGSVCVTGTDSSCAPPRMGATRFRTSEPCSKNIRDNG